MASTPLHSDVQFWRDPALPGVEVRASSYTRQAFRTHTHAEYSVGLVAAGRTRFTLAHKPQQAQPGQMVLIHPGEPHACNPDTGSGISYLMFYVAEGWLRGVAGGTPPRFPQPVVDDPELFSAWKTLHAGFAAHSPVGDRQALLLVCLRELVRRHAAQAAEPRPENPAVSLVRDHLADHADQRVPLDDLARLAGLSRHHFLRTFKAATGLPPHAYQLQQAVDKAKSLLAEGAPISQAALDSGFSDQSHFSRLFRQFTGATPQQYRRASSHEPQTP